MSSQPARQHAVRHDSGEWEAVSWYPIQKGNHTSCACADMPLVIVTQLAPNILDVTVLEKMIGGDIIQYDKVSDGWSHLLTCSIGP